MNPLEPGYNHKTIKFNELDEFMCVVDELTNRDERTVLIIHQPEFNSICYLALVNHFCNWKVLHSGRTLTSIVDGSREISISNGEWKFVLPEEQRPQSVTFVADHIISLTIER